MIKENLAKIGLNDKEITIYTVIIESVKITAQKIAQKTGINRTTVYSTLKQLQEKGFITEDQAGASRYFMTTGKTELQEVYRKEVQKIKDKKEVFTELIAEIESLPKSTSYSVPKIRFYDEIHIKDALYNQLPKWIESADTDDQKQWWGFQDVSMPEQFEEWFHHHWEIFPDDFGTRLLTNDKGHEKVISEKITDERRQIKYLPNSQQFTSTQAVLGDYVLFVITSSKPRYMIEIHDKVMAHNMREMFKLLWEKI